MGRLASSLIRAKTKNNIAAAAGTAVGTNFGEGLDTCV